MGKAKVVHELYAHMNEHEKFRYFSGAAGYGVWGALSGVAPIIYLIVAPSFLAAAAACVAVTVHIACIPMWQRWQKQFLCSTIWAKENGMTPQNLSEFDS